METHGEQEQGRTNLRVTANGLMTWGGLLFFSQVREVKCPGFLR